jgi:hypothetical protein
MGFQHMKGFLHTAASIKGGKIRGRKGLAAMTEEQRHEITSMGGKAKHEKSNTKVKNTQNTEDRESALLERILTVLDENV